jgi:hypothetical protein
MVGESVLVGDGVREGVWLAVGVNEAVYVGAPGSRGGSVGEEVKVAEGNGVGEGGMRVGASAGSWASVRFPSLSARAKLPMIRIKAKNAARKPIKTCWKVLIPVGLHSYFARVGLWEARR